MLVGPAGPHCNSEWRRGQWGSWQADRLRLVWLVSESGEPFSNYVPRKGGVEIPREFLVNKGFL